MKLTKLPSGFDAIILEQHPELKKQIDDAILRSAESIDICTLNENNQRWCLAYVEAEYQGVRFTFDIEATVGFVLYVYSDGEVECTETEIVSYDEFTATADGEDIEVFETEYQYEMYNRKSA